MRILNRVLKYLLLLACVTQVNQLLAKKTNTILRGNSAQQYVLNAAEVHIDKQTQSPGFIKFEDRHAPIAVNLVQQLKQWYSLNDDYDFELIRIDKDELGYEHHRFQQLYQGYEVKNMVVYVHVKNGKVNMINGQLETRFNKQFSFSTEFLNALGSAKKYIGAESYKWQIPKEEWLLSRNKNLEKNTHFPNQKLVIAPQQWNIENVESYHLCYELDMFAHQPETRNMVYIDANDDQVILDESLIRHADVEGTAQTKRSGTRTIQTNNTIRPGYFVLSETGRGNGIETLDANGNHFQDADNNWTLLEFDNAARDYAAIDAHWAAEVTYDYFLEKSYISVGDAKGFPYTFATLDIIAHEFVHGVTDNTAELIYVQEPGALNESFSDIFGTVVEFYGKPPNQSGDWQIGEDTGFSLRNLANPNTKGDPDTYGTNDPYWINTIGCYPGPNNDLCGLHVNSSVQNYWFYLLTNGGNGTNRNGDSYNVLGIGMDKAVKIAYRNLTTYLTPYSDYEDAKTFAIQSAIDMYGDCPPSPEVISTINAWQAVGIGEKYNANNALQPNFTTINPLSYCSTPQTIRFEGFATLPVNSYYWNFGDGNTSTQQNPTHTYTQPGNYTVSFEVKGCNNTNKKAKNNYIQIDDQSPCITTMPNNSTVIETACSGTLYDFGGPNQNYADLSEGILTLVSPNNKPITLTFTELGYEEGYDSLYIYDGNSENAPLIKGLNGKAVPPPITSSGGSITLKHFSDTYVVDKGFALIWSTAGNCGFSCASVNIQINSSTQSPSCSGNTDGSINNTIAGGTGPYNYKWNTGESTLNLSNKPAGNYTLTVTDKDQCASAKTITINKSNVTLQNTAEVRNETCAGENDGSITYSAKISDYNGCSISNEYKILSSSSLEVSANIFPASSNNTPNGNIQVNVNGGTPPYSYYWSNGVTTSFTNNLYVGNYWLNVSDAFGCYTIENYTITTNCPNALNDVNNPIINSGVQTANENITSNGIVSSGKSVTFKAGKTINLINNFEVVKGASFTVEIGGCD